MHLYQSIRAVEIDKDDIQQSYKEVCFENQRFKEANSQLTMDNRDMFGRLSQADEEI